MASYTIIRVYEVPAGSRIEATDRMMEALAFGVEKDYHVKDIVRDPGAKPGTGAKVSLEPPKGWLVLLLDQLLGRVETAR